MRSIVWGSLLAASFAAALTCSGDADACGGCFITPVQGNDTGTIVTAHRMALSVSSTQTILWDQIQYTGSPSEFAWVLPVKPGARIEVGSEAWFDVLDAATGTSVTPPRLICKTPGTFFCSVAPGMPVGASLGGCSASEDLAGGGDVLAPDPVEVVSHGATGPYESAVIHSDVPGALSTWLLDHGYAIPDDVVPVIEAYQNEGFDFAALRLLPSAGVQQMRPVRVVQSGASPTLPLRMVAAGTGPRTAITLFVIGEGRYTTKNFPEVPIPRDSVSWDFDAARSNYALVRDSVYSLGHSFFVPYSEPGALFDQVMNPVTRAPARYRTTSGRELGTIAEAFVEQAFINGETSSTDCADALPALADDDRRVAAPCEDPQDPSCSVDDSTEIDPRILECDPPLGSDIPLDDLAQALVGMHPSDVWVTRLEANLTRDDLAKDLEVQAAAKQVAQPGAFQTHVGTNLPDTCELAKVVEPAGVALPPTSGEDKSNRGGPNRQGPALLLTAIGVLAALRRLAGSRRSGRLLPSAGRALQGALEAAK